MSSAFYKVMNILDLVKYIQYYTDLRHLFSTSKELLYWRQELQYWKLNINASRQYRNKRKFQNTIDNLVSDPSKQISLNFTKAKIKYVSALGNVHTLDLSGCSNITDVSALGNVHTLNLSGYGNISDVST